MKKAAVAIIKTLDNKIALQLRDKIPGITNPGFIAMFGGTVEKSENSIEALGRELREELELNLGLYSFEEFKVYYKTKEIDGEDYKVTVFIVKNVNSKNLKLREGKSIVYLSDNDDIDNLQMTRITRHAINDFRSLNH